MRVHSPADDPADDVHHLAMPDHQRERGEQGQVTHVGARAEVPGQPRGIEPEDREPGRQEEPSRQENPVGEPLPQRDRTGRPT